MHEESLIVVSVFFCQCAFQAKKRFLETISFSCRMEIRLPSLFLILCIYFFTVSTFLDQMSGFNNELKQNLQEFSQELALSPTPANICTKNFHELNRYDENDSEVRDWVSLSENTLNIELLINAAKSVK